jgi:hypothetical protein
MKAVLKGQLNCTPVKSERVGRPFQASNARTSRKSVLIPKSRHAQQIHDPEQFSAPRLIRPSDCAILKMMQAKAQAKRESAESKTNELPTDIETKTLRFGGQAFQVIHFVLDAVEHDSQIKAKFAQSSSCWLRCEAIGKPVRRQ